MKIQNHYKQFIACCLCLCMMLTAMPVAYAFPSFGLRVGYVADGESVTISWDPYDGADYYLVAARDLTTDNKFLDNQQVYSNKKTLSAKYIKAGHQYHVWVGPFTDDGTQLANGNADFTVPDSVCNHPNMNLGTSHSPIYTSLGDDEHECITTVNMVCADCGYVQSNTTTTRESHTSYKVYEEGVVAYEQTVNGHQAVRAYVNYCRFCDELVDLGDVEVMNEEPHIYINGVCVCGKTANGHSTYPTPYITTEPVVTPAPSPYTTTEPVDPSELSQTPKPCDHSYERVEVGYPYYNLRLSNDDEHAIVVTYYDECTLCGYKTANKKDITMQRHTLGDEDYEDVHPHEVFKPCLVCEYSVYLNRTRPVKTCAQCQATETSSPAQTLKPCNHIFKRVEVGSSRYDMAASNDDKHAITVTYYKECILCGYKTSNNTETTMQRHTLGIESYEATHPHEMFKPCLECGYAVYSHKTRTVNTCAQCLEAGSSVAMNDTTLKKGESNSAKVRELQELLCKNGYSLTVDGSFGPKTEDAVKKFQAEYDLMVTGIVDATTWCVLREHADDITPSYIFDLNITQVYRMSDLPYDYIVPMNTNAGLIVYDEADINRHINLNDEGLFYRIARGSCTLKNQLCTFNTKGEVCIELVHAATNEVVGAITVLVTNLEVEDGFLSGYKSNYSSVVTLKDIESLDWQKEGVALANDVAVTDYNKTGSQIRLNAYNYGVRPYVFVSYDENGKEIDRAYVDTIQTSGSILETGLATFSRLYETFNNITIDNGGEKTKVTLKYVDGGCIQLKDATTDDELIRDVAFDVIYRAIETVTSAEDMVGISQNYKDVVMLLKKNGGASYVKAALDAALEESLGKLNAEDVAEAIMKDKDFMKSLVIEFEANIGALGKSALKSAGASLEDYAMLLSPATTAMNFGVEATRTAVNSSNTVTAIEHYLRIATGKETSKILINTIVIPE